MDKIFSSHFKFTFLLLATKAACPVEHLSALVCFVNFSVLFDSADHLLEFFLLGLQPFTHLLLFKGIQHIHENKHAKTAQHIAADSDSSLLLLPSLVYLMSVGILVLLSVILKVLLILGQILSVFYR